LLRLACWLLEPIVSPYVLRMGRWWIGLQHFVDLNTAGWGMGNRQLPTCQSVETSFLLIGLIK
jgi:hypothetical protein